jgi:RHS repeat-associated protein
MRRGAPLGLALLLAVVLASPGSAAPVTCGGLQLTYDTGGNDGTSPGVCHSFAVCETPVAGAPAYAFTTSGCDPRSGTCGMEATVAVQFPGNHQNNPGASGNAYSYARVDLRSSAAALVGYCGTSGAVIEQDFGTATVSVPVTCGSPAASRYTLELTSCPPCPPCLPNFPPPQCIKTRSIPLDFAAHAGCPVPPPDSCNEPSGDVSGAAGEQCPMCRPAGGGDGGGCGVSLSGLLACILDGSGPGAFLHYTGGGPGNPGLPGSTGALAWQTVLGRSWSHDHAERIVIDNVGEGIGHVWLITRYATFREFSNLAAGSGLRLYQAVAPSDEFRQLFYDTASSGWQLQGLDGSVEHFRADGQWLKTVLPTDTAHPTQGTYDGSGRLTRVDFPDGRSETYTYLPGGKLGTIAENTVGGAPARTWTYGWTGDHLTGIQRPDGTAWELTYGTNGAPPDHLSQIRLIATDGTSGRVAAAFDYDGASRVLHSWRGDPFFAGPNAVDKQTFTYTGAPLATETVVSQVVSDTFTNTTTFSLGRDTVSTKGKVLALAGNCPTCGLAPNTTFQYGGAQPLLPTAMIDGRAIRTESTYDIHGRLLTRTEAKGVAEQERTTTWIYDANFPGLAKEIDRPSTTAGQKRKTLMSYDPVTSVMTGRTLEGFESGASFSLSTSYVYNAAGRPLTIDPPGSGALDATSFTYGVPGTHGYLPDTRTDPLIGTTLFAYDGLNRRTSVTDVNNVQTITAYDALNRVTAVTRKGDPGAGVADLVTTYHYDLFHDLRCVQMPRGNGIAYGYDGAGRLIEVARKADCNPASQPLERTLYTLDGAGHRTLEERKRYDAGLGAEASDGKTEHLYTCHLDKTTQGKGSATESVTESCYDEDENLKYVWDADHPRGNPGSPNPATQTYTYDSLNRLTSISQPWTTGTADTRYGYDVQDHLAQVTDAESNVTTFTTSDRDLQTRQVSAVSGATAYSYDAHGRLTAQTDARGVVTTRTLDLLDRVTLVHSSNSGTPDVIYTYDAPCAFGKGRLCSIAHNGTVVGYAYDRFGRVTQDGPLAYGYDANGNRTQVTYPGGITAAWTYDFADRHSTLGYNAGAGSQPVVTGADYLSAGPLTKLVLANGLTERHLFDARYFPQAVTVTGSATLTWTYSVDNAGNITQITDGATPQTYSYVDNLYFLKQGDGPWGTRSWTYDRTGNRLTETRGATTDTYTYTNHNPRLGSILLGGGAGTRTFAYDASGNEIQQASPTSQLTLRHDGANRLVELTEETTRAATFLTYDGRNFLVQARQDINACSPVVTQSLYNSEGVLHGRSVKNLLTGTASKDTKILYFAGHPVGLLETAIPPTALTYLNVDHLGTPILESNSAGVSLWSGGFEPFGRDWNGAQATGEFLRFPGQWEDGAWAGAAGSALYYNVNRWYDSTIGDYRSPDPVGLAGGVNLYSYAWASPIMSVDPLGLSPRPLPPSRQQPRVCNPAEEAECIMTCGSNGMQSCMVSRTFRLVRSVGGRELWKWVDGPMSCSCKEPQPLLERCIKELGKTLNDMLQWLADHPPHVPPLPLPGPFPVPVPIPSPR